MYEPKITFKAKHVFLILGTYALLSYFCVGCTSLLNRVAIVLYRVLFVYHLVQKTTMILCCIPYLCVKIKFVVHIVECERWRRTDNVSAENGEFYPLSSVADCLDLCLSILSCVAIDIWSDACSLHMNASDLLSSRATSGVSQFVLDRSCAVSTAAATSLPTTGYGMLYSYLSMGLNVPISASILLTHTKFT